MSPYLVQMQGVGQGQLEEMNAIAILWVVLILALLIAIFVSAVLSIFLKERKKLWAVDTLLVSATLLIVVVLTSSLVLPPVKEKAVYGTHPKVVKECDAAVDDVSEAGYLTELPEPAHSIVGSFSSKLDKELRNAETLVQKHVDEYPNSFGLTARLAIILHAEGKDTAPVFEHFYRSGGQESPLLQTLSILYGNSEVKPPDQSTDKKAYARDYVEVIESRLPKGWYQKAALLDVYRQYDPDALKTALAAQHADSVEWQFRVQCYLVAEAILLVLGIASIVWFVKFKADETIPFVPITSDFRRMYACLISTLFAQVISAGAMGFYIGIVAALSHKTADFTSTESMMSTTMVLSGAIFCMFLTYFLILKPQSLSINAAFTRSALKLKPAQFVMFAIGGYCADGVLHTIGRTLYHLLPNAGRPHNSTQTHMIEAFATSNLPMICWSVMLACVIAPFTEELLFRGLLLGWLRNRFGSGPAILGSSVLFALCHFDLNGFLQYFSLGLVQSIVYNRTRNLWLAILIHGLWNFWVVVTVSWLTNYHK